MLHAKEHREQLRAQRTRGCTRLRTAAYLGFVMLVVSAAHLSRSSNVHVLAKVGRTVTFSPTRALGAGGQKPIGEPYAVVRTFVPAGREFFIRVHAPVLDSWLSVQLLNYGQVEESISHVIQEHVESLIKERSGIIHILDIGANIGFISLFAASLNERVRVTAVEPTPWHNKLLLESLALNPSMASRIKVFQVGVSSSNGGSLCMHVEGANGAATSATVGKCQDANDVTVPVTTIDELLNDSWDELPSIIKIDVEGFESHVFDGSRQTLAQLRASKETVIVSEYVPFRAKRAKHDLGTFEAFFSHFPAEDWDVRLISPDSYGLSQGADTAETLDTIRAWNEVDHHGGDVVLRPRKETLRRRREKEDVNNTRQ